MIDFIIVEDNCTYFHQYKKIIDKVMMNYDIEYDFIIYDKYSKEIQAFLTRENFKIYIISYSRQKKTNEMIKYIREELNDWQSLIILMYKEKEDIKTLEENNLFLLDKIPVSTNFFKKFQRDIQICLNHYDQRPNTLKFCYKKTYYNIEYWKIIYIEKEPESKKCKIKTIENSYDIQGGLTSIEKDLDHRFLKCNRSYLINLEQIENYNSKANVITFKNKEALNIVSREKRKEIMNYFRGLKK